jgi:hypothetical protein
MHNTGHSQRTENTAWVEIWHLARRWYSFGAYSQEDLQMEINQPIAL